MVDGTYLGIDTSHAHMNMPATLMWGRQLDTRPIRITFVAPAQSAWKVATQLFPTEDPWTFTAPNLQYLMDSPDGVEQLLAARVHREEPRRQGRSRYAPPFITTQPRLMWTSMQPAHRRSCWSRRRCSVSSRNSTPARIRFSATTFRGAAATAWNTATARSLLRRSPFAATCGDVLGTISHEFFHAWNVERIRPKSLEPFNFEEANMSGELWLAEGFTTYYGSLIMARAGLHARWNRRCADLADSALNVATSPGHQFRSLVEMSQLAPFSDAARSVDPTNFSYSFINYYPYGSAIALALDLELRVSDPRVACRSTTTCARCGGCTANPAVAQPGLVAKPYTLQDARDRLARRRTIVSSPTTFSPATSKVGRCPTTRACWRRLAWSCASVNPGVAWCGANIDGCGKSRRARRLGNASVHRRPRRGRRDPVRWTASPSMASSPENLAKASSLREAADRQVGVAQTDARRRSGARSRAGRANRRHLATRAESIS